MTPPTKLTPEQMAAFYRRRCELLEQRSKLSSRVKRGARCLCEFFVVLRLSVAYLQLGLSWAAAKHEAEAEFSVREYNRAWKEAAG